MSTSTAISGFHYDLVIVGGTAGGLSVAVSSLRSGLPLIRILEEERCVSGVVQLLAGRGFSLDRRPRPDNIHYEEYW